MLNLVFEMRSQQPAWSVENRPQEARPTHITHLKILGRVGGAPSLVPTWRLAEITGSV
jgi:hypothetical protein